MNLEEVIVYPIITEKAEQMKEPVKGVTKYTLKVRTDANKELIRQVLKKIYNVNATKVNVTNVPGKNKRFRNSLIKQPAWKKAIVTLESGQTIDFQKKAN